LGGVCPLAKKPSSSLVLVPYHTKSPSISCSAITNLGEYIMAPRKKGKKVSVADALLKRYHNPSAPGSLGGIQRFAKAYKIPLKTAQNLLKKDLAYTLHKPRRRRFPTLPVVLGGLDDQLAVDLIETQNVAKENQGTRYLLTIIDVLSKYAWVRS